MEWIFKIFIFRKKDLLHAQYTLKGLSNVTWTVDNSRRVSAREWFSSSCASFVTRNAWEKNVWNTYLLENDRTCIFIHCGIRVSADKFWEMQVLVHILTFMQRKEEFLLRLWVLFYLFKHLNYLFFYLKFYDLVDKIKGE